MRSIDDLEKAWVSEKVISIAETDRMTELRSDIIETGKSYAIWGAGILGEYFAKTIRLSGGSVAFFVDKSEEKQGQEFGGIQICSPDELMKRQDEYDALIIANHTHFDEIKKEAVGMGMPEHKIVMPIEMINSIGNRG